MNYFIIDTNSAQKLAVQVNEAISQGWVPLGGVSIAVDQGRYSYVQAMTKTN